MSIWFKSDKKETSDKKIITPVILDKTPFNTLISSDINSGSKSEYDALFIKLLKDLNLPGPDYFEFKAALDQQKDAMISESQKYQNIFGVLSTMGLTPQKLSETAQFYISKCNEKAVSFEAELKAKREEMVINNQTQAQTLNKEIEALKAQIQEKTIQMNQLLETAQSEDHRLNGKQLAFNSAHKDIVNILEGHIINFKNYLNANT